MERTYNEIMELVGKTAEIASKNTKETSIILTELKNQKVLLNGLANSVTDIDSRMAVLGNDIEQLKLNEEITTEQSETVRRCAEKRVVEIIGDNALDRQKYFKIFIRKLYSDTKKNAGLGSKIDKTKKGNFQRCIDYIEAWIPSCGCTALKTRADENAKARREAKNLGYVA